jgi:hypothetical protein
MQDTRHTTGLYKECAKFAMAHEYAPMTDRVIEGLKW